MEDSHWKVLEKFAMPFVKTAVDSGDTDGPILTRDGLIFGGLPFGTDSFINQMLYDKFKDWESFVNIQDGNKICFAQSIPLVRAPKKLKRDPSRIFNKPK